MCGNDTSDTRAPAFSNISATHTHASIVSWNVPGAWYSLGIPEIKENVSLRNRYQREKNLFYWAIVLTDCLPLVAMLSKSGLYSRQSLTVVIPYTFK